MTWLAGIVIINKLVQFLEEYNMVPDTEDDFKNKRSYLINFLVIHGIYVNQDNNILSGFICLDFQKDFDKVPHGSLLSKLQSAVIGEKLTKWIKNWLTLKERVLRNGYVVSSGAPQG